MVDKLNYQPQKKKITQWKANAKDAIQLDYWNILLRIPNIMPANFGGQGGWGETDTGQDTTQRGHKYNQTKIQSCAKTISSRKLRVLPKKKKKVNSFQLFKILLVTEFSSVLDHLPQGNGFVNQFFTQMKTIPVSSNQENIHKQQ